MTQNMDQPASVAGGTRVTRSQLFDLKKRALGPPKNRPVLEDLSNVGNIPSATNNTNQKIFLNQPQKQYLQKPNFSKQPTLKSELISKSASSKPASNNTQSSSSNIKPLSSSSSSTSSSISSARPLSYDSKLLTHDSLSVNKHLKNASAAPNSSTSRSFVPLSTNNGSKPSSSSSSSSSDSRLSHVAESKPRSSSAQTKPFQTHNHIFDVDNSSDSSKIAPLKRKSRNEGSDNEETDIPNNSRFESVQSKVDPSEINDADQADTSSRPAKRQRTQPWDDLDAEDFDDPLMVSEYAPEIFEYLYELEQKYMPNPNYMGHQTSINWSTRDVLMDWVVEIHWKLRLLPETLFLAGNIIDRFMTQRVVTLDKIQLVGTSALLIAAKYEEVFPPATKYFSMLTGGNFKEHDILSAEKFILQILGFELSYPNPLNFLRRISKADGYDVRNRSYGKYFLEIGCFEHTLLKYRPSHLAAASMYLSRMISGFLPVWNANLDHYAGDVDEKTLRPIISQLIKYLAAPKIPHETLFKKYASRKFFKASLVARKWAKDNIDVYSISHI